MWSCCGPAGQRRATAQDSDPHRAQHAITRHSVQGQGRREQGAALALNRVAIPKHKPPGQNGPRRRVVPLGQLLGSGWLVACEGRTGVHKRQL